MTDPYSRYALVNLPHARTIVGRIARSLEAHGAFREGGNGGDSDLRGALAALEVSLSGYDEDPPMPEALEAADAAAERGRQLVAALLTTTLRADRLGQHIRNLFECLGMAEEGARLSLECGERPDSPMR